jgi:hypothetical protein
LTAACGLLSPRRARKQPEEKRNEPGRQQGDAQAARIPAIARRPDRQTFSYPTSSREASAEIRRLKDQASSTRTERAVERKAISAELHEQPGDATRVRESEITGYGANCRWSH